jgi:hypothetical protein
MSESHYVGTTIVTGEYRGPKDLVEIGNYFLPLTKTGVGLISGKYTQQVKTSSGEEIHLEASGHYAYDEATAQGTWKYPGGLMVAVNYESFSWVKSVLNCRVHATVSPA